MGLIDDPWRAVCPAGHRSWEPTSTGYRCRTCRGTFDELADAKEVLAP